MRWVVVLALAGCGGSDASTPDGAIDGTLVDSAGAPTADELLAKLATCNTIGGDYATDSGGTATVSICGLPSAVFWKADLDVDCDGKASTQCNSTTDPAFQNQTSATDSHGDPLDAAALPYVVVPLPSSRFDYAAGGLALGSVIAVIYAGKVEYGVFGDEGPSSIIGEASYAMASSLGIDPDPSTGGVDTGVAYIAFTGSDAVVPVIEDHAMATALGEAKARALLAAP
jgi:hypothetical protein